VSNSIFGQREIDKININNQITACKGINKQHSNSNRKRKKFGDDRRDNTQALHDNTNGRPILLLPPTEIYTVYIIFRSCCLKWRPFPSIKSATAHSRRRRSSMTAAADPVNRRVLIQCPSVDANLDRSSSRHKYGDSSSHFSRTNGTTNFPNLWHQIFSFFLFVDISISLQQQPFQQ